MAWLCSNCDEVMCVNGDGCAGADWYEEGVDNV